VRSATARLLLLAGGLGIAAWLVWRAGPRLVWSMLARVGWSFPTAAAIYATHIGIRAAALWRSVLGGHVSYPDVLRVRLSGEAVEMLTFTGPFLAEPAKGWLLRRRGLATADAFAAVATEYLLYTVVSSWLSTVAISLLLARGLLPAAIRPAVVVVLAATVAFIAAFAFAAITGIGLIAPIVRASRVLIGVRRAEQAANEINPVEHLLVTFLHAYPRRLAEVFALEAAAHVLLILEIWIVVTALGFRLSWRDPLIVEGGVKFISIAFSFIPGQFGASEGVYELLVRAIGLPTAAGLTLALVRRMRGLLVAAAGLVALAVSRDG
jgi:hypothetical protein